MRCLLEALTLYKLLINNQNYTFWVAYVIENSFMLLIILLKYWYFQTKTVELMSSCFRELTAFNFSKKNSIVQAFSNIEI